MVLKGAASRKSSRQLRVDKAQAAIMRPSSKSDAAAGDADSGAADFLRRLSVADAKVLLERTRKEKEAKAKEMQKMIGVRYRDLIDSADKIVSMHSAAMRLESSLKEMPDKWKQMETALEATLTSSEKYVAPTANGDSASFQETTSASLESMSVHDRVLFIVTSHEQLWDHLDRGESNQALALYHRARAIFDSEQVQASVYTYPFLPSMWASVHSFEQRAKAVARVCLASRGKSAKFYADNLDALSVLDGSQSATSLLDTFLRSRTKWLQLQPESVDDGDSDATFAATDRHMRLNLRSLLATILHAEVIFIEVGSGLLSGRVVKELADSATSERVKRAIDTWFAKILKDISDHAGSAIAQIPTIAQIAQTQSKLATIETQFDAYRATQLWKLLQETTASNAASSVFELVFGKSLRKRTRDLVQHSFVDATTAIKNEIRTSLGAMGESTKMVRQLQSVKFYDFFDPIHNKVAGLNSSELQRVLAEEYMRSLFSVVIFLEAEYPWRESSDRLRGRDANPIFLLTLANILTSIVSLLPSRTKALFGEITGTSSAALDVRKDLAVFEAHSQDGKLPQEALQKVLQSQSAEGRTSFMDEEATLADSVGFFAFHLLSQTKAAAPFPLLFASTLKGLAEKYCEAWARQLLRLKIAPLRDFLQVEQYDLTNEEWIASHQGWSEQLIVDDDPSGDDSGDDGPATGEKVWLPWCETPTVSSFLFSCCYALDEAYRLVRTASGASPAHVNSMHDLIRSVLTEQLTIMSVEVYEEAVDLVVKAKDAQSRAVLNFGEFCMLQFLFDMYFVRATLGFSDFIRFGWGDEIDIDTCTPSVARLKKLFDRMHDFVDPVDWEIYGPQLIENVVVQFRKSRLLFSSLSEANDISEVNGKPIVVSAQDTRPIVKLAEPVPRFSLLPVPTTRRRAPSASVSSGTAPIGGGASLPGKADSLFHEDSLDNGGSPSLPSLKLQNLLSGSAGSNILSAAASGTNLLSSAAKGMSFLSSATSSYLREGANSSEGARSKYF